MSYISLFSASIAPLNNPELYEKAYRAVSVERRSKIDKFRFKKDKCLSLTAEILLRSALESIGENFDEMSLSYGENGKPYFEDRPDICFNISHSGEYALVAISDNPVGCDIEKVDEINLNIAKRFYTDGEYHEIIADEKNAKDLFFRYWTVKESFMKLTGLGMKLPLDAFSTDLNRGIIVGGAPIAGKYYFKEFTIDGYKIAVASTADTSIAKINYIQLFDCI